ncbi:cobalamin B12-binding domain-containing protein [Paenibacillus amylolyticus]|uniref:cobalamin B12-binding domain-containing protein n=1 Tax=Paenibacillus amylolyticus TaxID=1451 RepID=UPI003EBA7B04
MSHREAGERLLQDAGILAEKITEMQYRLQPDLMERFGPIGKIRTKQDSQYSLSYLAESVLVKSPSLFTHYISWLKVLLAGYQVSAEDLGMNLKLIKGTLNEEFEEPHRTFLLEYLEMGIDVTKELETQTSFIHASMPYGLEAEAYLQYLLDDQRKEAFEIIESEMDDGASIRDIYRYIFQPVQYEIGRLWQQGQISVGQEHFCTAATQSFISRLYSRWMIGPNQGKKLVAACVGSEQHEVGLRMLTDVFEMEGWDTYYLGANVPNGSIVEAIKHHESDVVAISVTMTYHLHLARELIERIREHAEIAHVKVMVGGYPFNIDKNLWRTVGADGYAPSAEDALAMAERLLIHPVSLDSASMVIE